MINHFNILHQAYALCKNPLEILSKAYRTHYSSLTILSTDILSWIEGLQKQSPEGAGVSEVLPEPSHDGLHQGNPVIGVEVVGALDDDPLLRLVGGLVQCLTVLRWK